jgi:hypothetical protein
VNCSDYYTRILSEERHEFSLLKIEHIALKDDYERLRLRALIEDFTHRNDLDQMRRVITGNLQLIVTISKQLDKFAHCSLPMMLMKTLIKNCLLILYFVNYNAMSY